MLLNVVSYLETTRTQEIKWRKWKGKGRERDKDERWHLQIEKREGLGETTMTEFICISLAFGERTAQLLPWDGSLIAMVTVGQSSHDCPWVTVHECMCVFL